MGDERGWSGIGWDSWTELELIRARLDAGADPNTHVDYLGTPLHAAAERGSPEVVAELAGRADDVDTAFKGRTALWAAVFANRPRNVQALVSAGADPWRPMMNGWSPGRLAQAGPTPGLLPPPSPELGLSEAEATAAAEAGRLIAALGSLHYEGLSLACVAGVTAAEAARRLEATPAGEDDLGLIEDDPWSDFDRSITIVGITDVPGGCVISQPWGYGASTPGVMTRVSTGTVCYAMYANPKSGNQGRVTRDGDFTAWDTHPGGGSVASDEPSDEILATYLYHGHALAYCCAGAGLRLTGPRPIIGPPDTWLRLPDRDYWS
ncbi:ankyrin repeat domain-containing protein [Nonomuraea angiospora]|uniref:ankyrin repeat domain-containing protein n=1 Tax=Nonomuraea angiospora TaxID=46172 RepID=UPI0029B168DF|nr:ankyrin repeat domain-containing protein [Nonomuraea angiospora]MDX3106679.1 ankyrin repeat domain-containing protein [Nonomuraea angiospora]